MVVAEKKTVRVGNSQGVVLPAEMCEALGLSIGDRIELVQRGRTIELRALPQKDPALVSSLDELFEGYSGSYQACETDWGAPVGVEQW